MDSKVIRSMSLRPSNVTITVDGDKFNAHTAHVGISTAHEHTGAPMMGTPHYTIECAVDIHDSGNMAFATLNRLFELANITGI